MDTIETVESSPPERLQQTTDKKSERPYSLMVIFWVSISSYSDVSFYNSAKIQRNQFMNMCYPHLC